LGTGNPQNREYVNPLKGGDVNWLHLPSRSKLHF